MVEDCGFAGMGPEIFHSERDEAYIRLDGARELIIFISFFLLFYYGLRKGWTPPIFTTAGLDAHLQMPLRCRGGVISIGR